MSLPVFTYGTLQIPDIMEAVTGRKFKSEPAALEKYNRFRIKNQVFPGIIPMDSGSVNGVVYFDLDNTSLSFLDAFEDVLYVRKEAIVICGNKKILAQVYVVGEEYRGLLSDELWDIKQFRQKHLDVYLKSCKKFHKEYKKFI